MSRLCLILCLAAACLIVWCSRQSVTGADDQILIFRGNTSAPLPSQVNQRVNPPEAAVGDSHTRRNNWYVIAGDVRQPAVFESTRDRISAHELLEQAGGSRAMYEPMLHLLRGGRVLDRRLIQQAHDLTLRPGDMLLVVGQAGVREPYRESSSARHVVCLGLAPYPVIVPLSAGQGTLLDLFAQLGQARELFGMTVVIPVRVYPREQPDALDPGTIVSLPSQSINWSSLRRDLIVPPRSLDSNLQALPADSLPPALDAPTGEDEHTFFENRTPATSITAIPVTGSHPARTIERTPIEPRTMEVPARPGMVRSTSLIHDTGGGSAPSFEPASPMETLTGAGMGIALPAVSAREETLFHPLAVSPARETVDLAQPAAHSFEAPLVHNTGDLRQRVADLIKVMGILSALGLGLAGLWSWCAVRHQLWKSLTTGWSIGRVTSIPSREATPSQAVDPVQALLDNRWPIVEEQVPAANFEEFHGDVIAQKRMRLDGPQPLAGPHFPLQEETPRRERRLVVTFAQAQPDVPSRRERLPLARESSANHAEQPSPTGAYPPHPADSLPPIEIETPRTERVRFPDSPLEHALRQVQQKGQT